MAPITIRKGTLHDLNFLRKIFQMQELMIGGGDPLNNDFFLKDSLLDRERNIVLIAEAGKKPAGVLYAELWKKKRFSFLGVIAVVPAFRRHGIALNLFRAYEKVCKKLGLKSMVMTVHSNNLTMQKFCRSVGAKKGLSCFYYAKEI